MKLLQKIKFNFQQQGSLTQIIIANITVFLVINLVGNLSHLKLLPYFELPIGGADFIYKFWTLFLYMFTHVGLWHLFFNMVFLYFFSQIFFTIMGQKKLLYIYVMSGIFGGALVLILGLIFEKSFSNTALIGASAAVFGVGGVMAVYSPRYKVTLFNTIELQYVYFYLLLFAVSTVIDLSINTGGKISHIGGAFFGLAYGYYLKRGIDLFNLTFTFGKKNKLKVINSNDKFDDTELVKKNIDHLLDKISKSGYDSLTKKEKEDLFKLSQKK